MKKGFTLIELLLVLLIFGFLFAATLTVLTNQDRSWRAGYNKLSEQQEARKAMDSLAELLRQTNPDWVINGIHYPVTITGGNRIDFYQPVFNASGEITDLQKITFKLNPADPRQLLKKEGTLEQVVVANDVDSVTFGGGCLGCATFNCAAVSADCPVVAIDVRTQRDNVFSLTSQITLRNNNVSLADDVEVEQPAAGEF